MTERVGTICAEACFSATLY